MLKIKSANKEVTSNFVLWRST